MKTIRHILPLTALLLWGIATGARAQGIALHTDVAAWGMKVMNAGADFVLTETSSVDVTLYQSMGDTWLKDTRVTAAQVAYRYWLSHQPLESLYVGVTATPAVYKSRIGGSSHDGECVVGGIGLGYCWPLSHRWNVQAAVGVGVTYLSEAVTRPDGTRWQRYKLAFTPADAELRVSYIIK